MKCIIILLMFLIFLFAPSHIKAQAQVNMPHLNSETEMNKAAITWFGSVTNNNNYADVRMGYTDTTLHIYLHIFDRYLWYNPSPSIESLQSWDSVNLFLSTQSSPNAISGSEYYFSGGFNGFNNQRLYEAAYRGVNGTWNNIPLSGFTRSDWRGNAPNDTADDRGWVMYFSIPFSALGLTQKPTDGTIWKGGLQLFDKDASSSTQPAQSWPNGFSAGSPSTWAKIQFGLPAPPINPPTENLTSFTLRKGLTTVTDAHIGGSTMCGHLSSPEYFPTWGLLNYNGATQLVEQNQWDVADWPCFSKILLNFDLSTIPRDKILHSATLSLYQFGNSDPANATASYIQVLSIPSTWTEPVVNWNNAPIPTENISMSRVDPVSGSIVWPGWKRDWDISYGLSKAYLEGRSSFSVVLYSADGDYHSGKYFTSSDIEDWNATGRPTINLTLAEPGQPTPNPLTGDLNHDNSINILDFVILSNSFGTANPSADLNSDGTVDTGDYLILKNNFGRSG